MDMTKVVDMTRVVEKVEVGAEEKAKAKEAAGMPTDASVIPRGVSPCAAGCILCPLV
jgi:hypothetical protein